MAPAIDSSRSSPSTDTLSCITVVGVASDGVDSTPPTSVGDEASILSAKDVAAPSATSKTTGSRRVSRHGTGIATYNENALSKATRPPAASPSKPKANSVLGKRARDSRGSGKRRVSRRLIEVEKQKNAPPESPKKQTRQAVAEAKDEAATAVIQVQQPKKPRATARSKKYLAQGLYVGQDPSHDPRYTEEKNKKRLAAKGASAGPSRSILPEPMFAGKRLIEMGRGFRLPFNICSPLPPGQSRPDEWRKTQKNVFVGDAAEFWRYAKRMEHSTCICEPSVGCDEHCLNRYMFYECDAMNCIVGARRCGNRAFEDLRERVKNGGKFNVGVDVIKTADRGYGVRSNRCFEPNQIIMEYTGEIITQEECDDRMYNRYKDNECFYLMMFDQNMIIDATRGSIARFVNHSCEPNCRMEKWTVAGKPRMALFAGDEGIYTGEELTYDYNFDPFSSKSMTECRCGSAKCRGVLGPRANRDAPQPNTSGEATTSAHGIKRKAGAATNGSPAKKRKTDKKAASPQKKRQPAVATVSPKRKVQVSASPKKRQVMTPVSPRKKALAKAVKSTTARATPKVAAAKANPKVVVKTSSAQPTPKVVVPARTKSLAKTAAKRSSTKAANARSKPRVSTTSSEDGSTIYASVTIPSPAKGKGKAAAKLEVKARPSKAKSRASTDSVEPQVVVQMKTTSSKGKVEKVRAKIGGRQTTLAFTHGTMSVSRA